MYKYKLLVDADNKRQGNVISLPLNSPDELINRNHWFRLHPDIYEAVNPVFCEVVEIKFQRKIYTHQGNLIYRCEDGDTVDINGLYYNRYNITKIKTNTYNEILSIGDKIEAESGWSFDPSGKEFEKIYDFPISSTGLGYIVYVSGAKTRNWYNVNKVKLTNNELST